jgi:hypothetical protein
LEPAERNVLDEREDVALEGREVDELAVPLGPARTLARGVRPKRASAFL